MNEQTKLTLLVKLAAAMDLHVQFELDNEGQIVLYTGVYQTPPEDEECGNSAES